MPKKNVLQLFILINLGSLTHRQYMRYTCSSILRSHDVFLLHRNSHAWSFLGPQIQTILFVIHCRLYCTELYCTLHCVTIMFLTLLAALSSSRSVVEGPSIRQTVRRLVMFVKKRPLEYLVSE